MPAGVRVQQLTPVVRTTSNQPTTIVRLMSPGTSTIRSGIGQQQIFQLNTNKQQQQQQPFVIKAITASTTNRQQQQQPILLTTNTQQSKTILPQTQQQVLVLNQGQQQKFTLQMTNKDHSQQESTTTTNNNNNNIPQLDGIVDDQVKIIFYMIKNSHLTIFYYSHYEMEHLVCLTNKVKQSSIDFLFCFRSTKFFQSNITTATNIK
jgi:hypothetical protein